MIEVPLEHLPHRRRRVGIVRDGESDAINEHADRIRQQEWREQLILERAVLPLEQEPHRRVGGHDRNRLPRTVERDRREPLRASTESQCCRSTSGSEASLARTRASTSAGASATMKCRELPRHAVAAVALAAASSKPGSPIARSAAGTQTTLTSKAKQPPAYPTRLSRQLPGWQ